MTTLRNRLAGLFGLGGWLTFAAGLVLAAWPFIAAGVLLLLILIFLLGVRERFWWLMAGFLMLGTTLFVYFPLIIRAVAQ